MASTRKVKVRKTITKPDSSMQWKMVVAFMVLMIVCGSILAYRLFRIQITQHNEWENMAMDQLLKESEITPKRGTIYDRNLNVLAQSANVWRVEISPYSFRKEPENSKNVSKADWPLDEEKVTLMAKIFEQTLGVSEDEFRKKCEKNTGGVEIAKAIEKPERDAIQEYINDLAENKDIDISGVYFYDSNKRYYTYDNLASSVIGFVNKNGEGAAGIESMYESVLKGTPGKIIVAKNGQNKDLSFKYEKTVDEEKGSNLVLTLDLSIQTKLEKHLKNAVSQNKVENKATGIVMDVNTGAVLGMATIPDYNLNDPYTLVDQSVVAAISAMEDLTEEEAKARSEATGEQVLTKAQALGEAQQQQWRNKAISDTYHPGSVFKPITTAMALEEGQTTLSATFNCPGYIQVADRKINCHKTTGHGHGDLSEGMKRSCNPVFISLGLKVGIPTFSSYFSAFGLTETTGIDLPGEGKGIYYPEEDMKEIDLATASFGQSFTLTSLQMITAMSAIANGGYLVEPHVVDKIIDDDGNIVQSSTSHMKRQVISTETSNVICEMLEGVVSDGTGRNAYLEGYRIAGKTGTSEKLLESIESGEKKYVASFCGFAPADNPKIAVLVMLDEPEGESHMGGAIAAPVVKEIMADILPLLGIEPMYSEEDLQTKNTTTPDVVDTAVADVKATMQASGLNVRIIGNGEVVVKQVPRPNSVIPTGGTVIIYTDGEESTMTTVPNLIGLTPEEANNAAVAAGLNLSFSGSGYEDSGINVRTQSIDVGTSVEIGTVITVTFLHTENLE